MNIIPHTASDLAFAESLSAELNMQTDGQESVVLVASPEQSFLRRITPPVIDWAIDFSNVDYTQGFSSRGRQKDPLARALGLNKRADLRILDMSAGLGKDALWMAHCGASVVMIE